MPVRRSSAEDMRMELISEGRGGVRLKGEAQAFYAVEIICAKTARQEGTRNM